MQTLKPKLIKILIVLACSALMMVVIFSRLDLSRLASALGRVHTGWLVAAGLTFGGGLLCAAVRWGTALKAGAIPVRPGPLMRASLAGHFFNTIFLGPAGGDVAKSSLFARWHGSPVSTIYASALLDRAFSVGGSILFTVVVVALAIQGPLLNELHLEGSVNPTLIWLVPLALIGLIMATWKLSSRVRTLVSTLKMNLTGSVQRLKDRPVLALRGCVAGSLGQACNTAILPLCLASVASVDIAWSQMLWAFPVIAVVASLPVTVGGSGVREGAALVILARYHIPAEDIVAAGLLTLGVYLGWAVVGACMGWREELAFIRGQDEAT